MFKCQARNASRYQNLLKPGNVGLGWGTCDGFRPQAESLLLLKGPERAPGYLSPARLVIQMHENPVLAIQETRHASPILGSRHQDSPTDSAPSQSSSWILVAKGWDSPFQKGLSHNFMCLNRLFLILRSSLYQYQIPGQSGAGPPLYRKPTT
jgi:hypothetical protein